MREVQSLAGSLNFACSVVAPGRPFIRRIYQTTWGLRAPQPDLQVAVSEGMKQDIQVWLSFLDQFNGVSMFLPNEPVLDIHLNVYVASVKGGFGVVCGTHWLSQSWPKGWSQAHAVVKQLYPVVVLCHMFGHQLKNSRLLLQSPIFGVVKAINRLSAKNPQVMVLIRDLVAKLLLFNLK